MKNFVLDPRLLTDSSDRPDQPTPPTRRTINLSSPLLGKDVSAREWQTESIPDAHLLVLQICRATLAAGFLLSILTCITTQQSTVRFRLQCALAATACGVSSLFYRHLYELRRLPDYAGYSQEGNTVSNALRFTSWAVTIAMLAWIAFLLRGPFAGDPSDYLGLEYAQWLYIGPILATSNVLLGIPGWEAARVFSGTSTFTCTRLVSLLVAILFLGGGACISLTINVAMHMPTTSARTVSERNLARWLSWIWVAYPALQFLKTIAVYVGADHTPRLTNLAERILPLRTRTNAKSAVQFAFKTLVGAPAHHARELHHLYSMLEPEHIGGGFDVSTPTIRPRWTQLLDTLMAVVDTLSQGVLALVLVTYALPVSME